MNYGSINTNDMNNGDGVRVSLFCSGCPHKCEGCFNKNTWGYRSGNEFTKAIEDSLFDSLDSPYIAGLSILGGEPLAPRNFETILNLSKRFKVTFPDKDLWLWSGYTLEEIVDMGHGEILEYLDTLIDGKFVIDLHDSELEYRGSSNQRILKKGVAF